MQKIVHNLNATVIINDLLAVFIDSFDKRTALKVNQINVSFQLFCIILVFYAS